jgi:PIN domain nuclease of toxin-antitoxin system
VLLDTCAAIWLVNGDPMSAQSRAAIKAAQAGPGVFVSPISAWEAATLVARTRLQLALAPETWSARLIGLPGVRLAPMPPELLIASAFLPGRPPRDPADRIIAATARAHDPAIVTRDSELIPYGEAGHLLTQPTVYAGPSWHSLKL